MPDPSYVIETDGREAGLAFHLETAFYPPIHPKTKAIMTEVFKEYWDGDIAIEDLDGSLATRAGYVGGVGQYNFHMFLNDEDLN